MDKIDAIVFFSGGMDSLIHLVWAKMKFDNVQALYVNFGHRYAKNEMEAAHKLCNYFGIGLLRLDIPLGQFEQDDSFLPMRNLFLLQLGTYFSDNLVFGMLYHEGPPDKRPEFIHKMERLLNSQLQDKKYFLHDRKIKIHTPFADNTKTEMLRWYIKKATKIIDSNMKGALFATVGCYSPIGHCGKCISCFNRWVALTNCGMSEKYNYSPPLWAAEQLIIGKKKRQSLLGLSVVLYKWKYIKEIYTAMRKVVRSPIWVAWKMYRKKDVQVFRDRAYYVL